VHQIGNGTILTFINLVGNCVINKLWVRIIYSGPVDYAESISNIALRKEPVSVHDAINT